MDFPTFDPVPWIMMARVGMAGPRVFCAALGVSLR
jgi:hypothetical protein